jgi:hypothetical protein
LRNNGAFCSKFGILGGLRVSDPAKISHLMAENRKIRNVAVLSVDFPSKASPQTSCTFSRLCYLYVMVTI